MQFCVFTHRETGRPTPIEHPNVAHTLNSDLSIRNYPLYSDFDPSQEALNGIFHEAADGHRANASRHRRDDRCLRLY